MANRSWFCSQCPEISFKTEKALIQHFRCSYTWHPFCGECLRYFETKSAFEKHVAESKHDPTALNSTPTTFDCLRCSRSFSTSAALQEHYRQSPNHPKCIPCRQGFKNRRYYDEHISATHSRTVSCSPCGGRQILVDDLQSHFQDSPNHPKCGSCAKGFKSDAEYSQHIEEAHADSRCAKCRRVFDNPEELEDHYIVSSSHPICEICNQGFVDDNAFQKHATLSHPSQSLSMPSGSIVPSPVDLKSSVRSMNLVESNSPNPSFSSCTELTASYATGRSAFSPFEGLSRLGFDSLSMVDDLVDDTPAWSSEISPESNFSRPIQRPDSPRGIHFTKSLLHPINTGPWKDCLPFPPSASSSCSPDTTSPLGLAALPIISPLASTPTDVTLINSATTPSSRTEYLTAVQSSPISMPAVLYRTDAEHQAYTQIQNDSLVSDGSIRSSRSSTLSCSSPDLSTYNLFENDMLSMESPLQCSPLESAAPTSAIDPPYMSLRKAIHLRGAAAREQRPTEALAKPALSLHCRYCNKTTCDDPAATMCGHLFCYGCITDQVIRTSKCPVCATPNLLYCIFRLHLS